MLIGDKGQSGGRRWEVSGFGLGPFSDSPKVSRWGGGKFCLKGIFYQSQCQTLGYAFWGIPILHKVIP